jgi:hypothetical protein
LIQEEEVCSCARPQCCCCVALVTSQLEDEGAPADVRRRAQNEMEVQSGFESGTERSHCCSAHKLNITSSQQQQQHQCDSSSHRFVNNSSFESGDVKSASQPGQDLIRGRLLRQCSQGNCAEQLCVDDQCCQQDGESVRVQQQQQQPESEKMRLVKKCSLDGSCGPEGERSFQSVSFESGPRWSCGVPGLGASIQQVNNSHLSFIPKLEQNFTNCHWD